jgi:hypothetical protein
MALSNSSKSSRASSFNNLFGLGGSKNNPRNDDEIKVFDTQDEFVDSNEADHPLDDDENYRDHTGHDDDIENTYRPSRHLTTTQNHPMGRILLGLLNENVRAAKRSASKTMELNIDVLCQDFCEAMQMMNDSTRRNILQANAAVQQRILDRELNAHTINMSIEPPTYFSPRSTIHDLQHKAEVMRFFPRKHKFNGSLHDNATDIVEFLGLMNDGQEEYNLSEKEFKSMLMASTTGKPHALIRGWIANNEDVQTIYHNLVIHYDKRLPPDEAKLELSSYKAPKNSNLAKVEAHLTSLAHRAATMLPAGPSRTAYYNMEVIHAIIRSLPPTSSSLVQMKYNELSAKQGRAATVAELSRHLHSVRYAIDKDIKTNGYTRMIPSHPRFGLSKAKELARRGAGMGYKAAYAVTKPANKYPERKIDSRDTKFKPRREGPHNTLNGGRYNPVYASTRTFNRPFNASRQNTSRSGSFPQRKFGTSQRSFTGNRFQGKYCSLCGKKDHTAAQGCPNIVNDAGTQIKIMPTLGTCQSCPTKIMPRLNHPSQLCPYRVGGPLEKSL